MIKQKYLSTISKCFLLSLIFIILSCAVNPVTGKRELMLVSTDQEIAIGKETDGQVVEQYGIYPDQNIQNYISELGKKFGPITHRPELPYSFKILDTDVINAFAVPGGYVYFTRGILAYLNDEAQLAGILGHELGHITARHTAKQISKSQLAQIGLGIGSVVSETFREYAGLANFGVSMLFLKFSRDNERQADDLGVEYSSKVGYDANGMAEFFETLERMHPEDGSSLPGWMSTHPNPDDRVGAVQNKTREWKNQLPNQSFVRNKKSFLQKMDGIVFGPDPRQGFVENNAFYHPTLKFQFSIPANWQVNNLPSQVQMFPESQEAAVLFSVAKQASPDLAANQFIQDAKATVLSNSSTKVNGMNARVVVSDVASDQQTLQLMSYFIQKGNQVYIFHGLSSKEKYSSYQSFFQSSITSFKNLTDRQKLDKKPKHLKLRTVARTGSLKNTLTGFGIKQDELESIALLNGLKLDDSVSQGSLIKTVVE
jgi:predicted Zn-dependent protease